LDGIRVLDFGRAAQVPYAAQVLGDFGADVIKIEARDGGIRGAPPALGGSGQPPAYQGRGDGLAYRLSLNRNKRSIVLDLKMPAGKEVVRRLVKVSDVVMKK
jgi:crotonobetainyl-CoA:carnitine CoA-transferase CaiB-like acyl-CoA transferase